MDVRMCYSVRYSVRWCNGSPGRYFVDPDSSKLVRHSILQYCSQVSCSVPSSGNPALTPDP